MLRLMCVSLLWLPLLVMAEVRDLQIEGDWEWLGNSFEPSPNQTDLLRTGPSIMRFSANGRYEYISIHEGKQSDAVVGTWVHKDGVLSITRPDNGTFNNVVLSYENGILETRDSYMGVYMYMKKIPD